MSIRDTKRKARRDLHEAMQVPALYLLPAEPGPWADPVPCGVRLHLKFGALGDLKGTNVHYAEREDINPRGVFLRDQVDQPARDAVISVAPGEAYRIDHTLPADDEFVTAVIVPLSPSEAADLPVPDAAS